MATKGRNRSDVGTAEDYFSITPNDGADLSVETRWISVATAGDLAVQKLDGTSATLTLPVGLFPIRAKRVLSTGTTASGLVGYV